MFKKILVLSMIFVLVLSNVVFANVGVTTAAIMLANSSSNNNYNSCNGSVLVPHSDEIELESLEFKYLLKIANKIKKETPNRDKELIAITAINFVFGNIEEFNSNHGIDHKLKVIKALVKNMK